MRTVVRSFGTLTLLLALVFVAGSAARAQGRHDLRDRHDNGLHRGWYIGQHRGWYRNNNNTAYRRARLHNRLRTERRDFRREERAERRAFRSTDANRADRRAFRLRERQERTAFRTNVRAQRSQYWRNHR